MGQLSCREAAASTDHTIAAASAGKDPKQGSSVDYVPVTDRIRIEFRSRHEQLLAAEKELRGRLYSEYTEQLREFEPTLRVRGEMIGEALLDAVTSERASNTSYADILQASLKNTPAERLPVREVVQSLDPLITPILNPFVEGLQAPINKAAGEMRFKLYVSWAATALAGAAAGFVLGRFLPRPR